jgi:hypothetical protein
MEEDQLMIEAEETLAEVARIRTTARDVALSLKWHTSVLWGTVFLASVLVGLAFGDSPISFFYWVVAVPLAVVLTWRIESPLPHLNRRPIYPSRFGLITTVMMIGSFGPWWVFDARPSALVWYSVLLAGFAAFAAIDGHRSLVLGLAVLWVWGVLVWLFTDNTDTDVDLVMALFTTAIGAGFLGMGFAQRLDRR